MDHDYTHTHTSKSDKSAEYGRLAKVNKNLSSAGEPCYTEQANAEIACLASRIASDFDGFYFVEVSFAYLLEPSTQNSRRKKFRSSLPIRFYRWRFSIGVVVAIRESGIKLHQNHSLW